MWVYSHHWGSFSLGYCLYINNGCNSTQKLTAKAHSIHVTLHWKTHSVGALFPTTPLNRVSPSIPRGSSAKWNENVRGGIDGGCGRGRPRLATRLRSLAIICLPVLLWSSPNAHHTLALCTLSSLRSNVLFFFTAYLCCCCCCCAECSCCCWAGAGKQQCTTTLSPMWDCERERIFTARECYSQSQPTKNQLWTLISMRPQECWIQQRSLDFMKNHQNVTLSREMEKNTLALLQNIQTELILLRKLCRFF